MKNIIEQVCKTIDKYNMFDKGDKVIIGVSGGIDSICLLHILNLLKDKYKIDLYIAHLNHGLRSEAEEDAQFVKNMGNEMNIPVYIREIDINDMALKEGLSTEMVGRRERYKFFASLAKEIGAKKISTAHNMNDQAETVLMRIIRGTGPDGLEGIKPYRNDGVVRPLLEVNRNIIEEYCSEKDLKPRIDKTNLQPIYTRNKVRLELIPKIKNEYNPNFLEAAVKTADMLRVDNEFINGIVEEIANKCIKSFERGIIISCDELSQYHPAIQKRLIRKAISEEKGNLVDIDYNHINEVLDMVFNNKGSAIDLPGNLKIKKSYNNIHIYNKSYNSQKNFIYKLKENETIFIKEINVSVELKIQRDNFFKFKLANNKAVFDYDKIKKDIYIRNRLPGDRFQPLGMKGTKKLKDFFIDLKIPTMLRDSIPLIISGDDILWVVGYRINEEYKCTARTKNILIITVDKGEYDDEE